MHKCSFNVVTRLKKVGVVGVSMGLSEGEGEDGMNLTLSSLTGDYGR